MHAKIHSIITAAILTLGTLLIGTAAAADKTDTLKGTITLGATGYGIRLDDGKVIRFMGRGGNTVFAVCHNGDACEITGVVTYNTKPPLFLSVLHARKLAGPATTPTVALPSTIESAAPVSHRQSPDPVPSQEATQAKPSQVKENAPPLERQSPFLLENAKTK